MMLLVVFGHTLGMIFRGKGIRPVVAMIGFMLWVYASITYIVVGSPISILLVAFWPLAFWIWYYCDAIYYNKELYRGIIKPMP